MRPDVVVDVGNSRIKWGRCSTPVVHSPLPPHNSQLTTYVSLPHDEPARAAQVLADPTRDMRDPMMGPWPAERHPLSGVAKAGVAYVGFVFACTWDFDGNDPLGC